MLLQLCPRVHRRYSSLPVFGLIVENFGAWLLKQGLLDRLHTRALLLHAPDRAPSPETRRRPCGRRRAILTGRPQPEEGWQECLGHIAKRVFANCTRIRL
jgi:hypothetical protein